MSVSLSTSTNNVYNIMGDSSVPLKNLDSRKALSIGKDVQRNIQEQQAAASKGATETFRQELRKIDILA